jgi:hypothetical protein
MPHVPYFCAVEVAAGGDLGSGAEATRDPGGRVEQRVAGDLPLRRWR